ncbi:MAG: hypothetical protein K2J72_10200, partial [Oscillospiraceae bacterium]|nr:hypothetical protein [Oscillospiraceae bacterium]
MKKTSAFISAIALSLAVMLALSGCTEQKNDGGGLSDEAELIDDISVGEASAETAPSPSDALRESFDSIGSYAELCFGYTSDGKYEPVDPEEYSSAIYAMYTEYMTSEEFYSTALEYDEYKDMSYEDFKKEMYSSFGIDTSAAEKYSKYSMFITVSYYSADEDADHSAAARKGFDFFAEKLSEDSTFSADKLDYYRRRYVT